jgi:catalase-peroxidase
MTATYRPVMRAKPGSGGQQATNWWPDSLRLDILSQHDNRNPLPNVDYRAAFQSQNYEKPKIDLHGLMTDPQDWWPADFGYYSALFVRMAWHSQELIVFFMDGAGAVEASNDSLH